MAPRKPSLTLGIEEEYLLVDPRTGELVAEQPPGLMPACKEKLGDHVTHELLLAQIEVGTAICTDVAEARADLARLRRTVAGLAADFGLAIVATSTHPLASWRTQKSVDLERYRILTRDLQALARRLVVCGMHVHAGVEDDDLRIDLMNQVAYFLPHLLALSASSPFWEGQDTGLKAFRPTIFGDLPRSGMPETFESYREWQRLLEIMAECGVCDDPSKIWWDVRPSAKQPTLEMRICDICTHFEDAVTIAALYQSILALLFRLRANNQRWRQYRPILLNENKWRAQRWGVEGELADFGQLKMVPFAELVEELVTLLTEEARELGCLPEVQRAPEIVARGTSADHQLRVYREARAAGAEDVEARRAVARWLIEATLEGVPD